MHFFKNAYLCLNALQYVTFLVWKKMARKFKNSIDRFVEGWLVINGTEMFRYVIPQFWKFILCFPMYHLRQFLGYSTDINNEYYRMQIDLDKKVRKFKSLDNTKCWEATTKEKSVNIFLLFISALRSKNLQ